MLLVKVKSLNNAALRNEDGTLDRDALANIVENLSHDIRHGKTHGVLMDYNGNSVGSFTLNFRRVSK